MTLVTQSTKSVAQGNGATTTWPFDFLIPALGDMIVTLVDIASGNQTTVAPVNFSVTGLGNAAGGSVTYPLSGSPLTSATQIVVERFVPDVQQTDLTNQGAVYPADIEDALDYLTMITQQQQDQINRSIVFSVADTVEVTLPVASARANKFLGFNASGDPVAVDGLAAGTTVSAAMIPVVTAPTTADALTALGLPGNLLDLLIPSGVEWPYHAGEAVLPGFVFPIGQACTSIYPDYRAKLIAAGSPYGTNGVDPLMPDRRSTLVAGKSNMGGVDNGLLTGGTVLGAILGTQTKTLAVGNLPTHTHTSSALTDPGHSHTAYHVASSLAGGAAAPTVGAGALVVDDKTSTNSTGISIAASTGTNASGLATPLSVVQPTIVANVILKVH